MSAEVQAVLSLAIPNRIPALRGMSEWLAAGLQRLGAPDPWPFNFDLCASEAVANIISYAYPDGGAHQIELRLRRDGPALSLEIEDDGVPFNPLEREGHERPASLADAPVGGLGIDLMRSIMRECQYARRDGRNVLRLTARTG